MAFIWMVQATAAQEHVGAVSGALLKLAPEGQNAPGSIRYEYFQSKEDPTQFMHFSIWESEADKEQFNASQAHQEILGSLPEDAWIIPPAPTVLQAL